MVDIGAKPVTQRRAVAEARVQVSPALAERIAHNTLAKGDLLAVARLAGIQAAKRTDELIPLCHSLPLDSIDVRAELRTDHVYLWAEAKVNARTGVEMEALTAARLSPSRGHPDCQRSLLARRDRGYIRPETTGVGGAASQRHDRAYRVSSG